MQFKYRSFEESFRQMLKDAENSTDISKHSAQALTSTKVMTVLMHDQYCMAIYKAPSVAEITTSYVNNAAIGLQPEAGQQRCQHYTDKQQG